MKIKKVILKNFRSFDNVEIDLEDLHCFVGANATGKSNFLYALDLILGERSYYGRVEEEDFYVWASKISDSLLIKVIFDEIFFKNFTISFSSDGGEGEPSEFLVPIPFHGLCLEAKRREKRTEAVDFPVIFNRYLVPATSEGDFRQDSGFYFFNNVNETNISIGVKEQGKNEEKNWLVIARDRQNSGWPTKENGDKKWGRQTLRKDSLYLDSSTLELLPTFLYLDENRLAPEASKSRYSIVNRILQDFQWNYRKKVEDEERIKLVKKSYHSLKSCISGSTTGLKELEGSLNLFFGKMLGRKVEINLEYVNKLSPFLSSYFSKIVKDCDVSIAGSGTGFNCLLTLGMIYFFQKVLKEKGRKIVVGIDEPELYLHPQARSEYLNLLMELSKENSGSPVQVIYTTHSPELVPLERIDSITRFGIKDGTTQIYPRSEILDEVLGEKTVGDHLSDIPEFRTYERIYLRENNELFFANKVIIVEGPLEKYTLGFLCDLNPKFKSPKQWPTVICAHGKGKIKDYQLICRAFSIPYFTFFDGDEGVTNKEKENSIIEQSVLDDYHAKIPGSFESQFVLTKEAKYSDKYSKITSVETWENVPDEIRKALVKLAAFISN